MTDSLYTQRVQIQRKLAGLGLYSGEIDGDWGQKTYTAIARVIDGYSGHHTSADLGLDSPVVPPKPTVDASGPIPGKYLMDARATGIVVHWTAGTNVASPDSDLPHYHFVINGDGTISVGDHSIKDNDSTVDGVYAAHTRGHNTGIIGVALAGMAGALQQPYRPGPHPINKTQWEMLPRVLAQLCRRYGIAPDKRSVLSHAEVQGTLGIAQAGKWDISVLPWDTSIRSATEIGNRFRAATALILAD